MERDRTKELKQKIKDLEQEQRNMSEEINYLLNTIRECKAKTGIRYL